MHRRVIPLAAAAALACAAQAPRLPEGTWFDLTHRFDAETIYWPTEGDFRLERVAAGKSARGWYYAANRFAAAEHGGTHLDAPLHFAEGRRSVDQIPVRDLAGPGVVIDVEAACAADRDYAVRVEDLYAWERRHGAIPAHAIVLLRTGFGRFWPDRERYLGTAARGPSGVAALRFPGLDPRAARWLVEERSIRAVGIDTASIDPGASRDFESHRVLAERDVPALENLAGLGRLPPRGFVVLALPMKIGAGTGAPLRAVAIVAE
jgi:kynurenine formamidase